MDAAGRYAPSPSAALHLGNLRTALIAWLAARHTGSKFSLRIDDLDAARSRADIADGQVADLRRLGLDFDGEIMRQSARVDRYAAAFEALAATGHVYPCFCTRAEIRAAVSAPHGDPTGDYPGTCSSLSAVERAAHEAAGRRPAWRLRGADAPYAVTDLVQGTVSSRAQDVVLRRADGAFGYQLAVVVDDADQAVREVVRGADLLDSVATQAYIAGLLQLPAVGYAHVPLMLGPDGARLAKRHGDVTLADALAGDCPFELPGLERGAQISAPELVGALAATVNLAEPGETPNMATLVERFAYAHVPRESTMMQA